MTPTTRSGPSSTRTQTTQDRSERLSASAKTTPTAQSSPVCFVLRHVVRLGRGRIECEGGGRLRRKKGSDLSSSPSATLPQLHATSLVLLPSHDSCPVHALARNNRTDSAALCLLLLLPGRPFEAAELRLKSFHELHTLWYLLLREKNVYYTQMAEAARRGVHASVIKRMGTQTQRAKVRRLPLPRAQPAQVLVLITLLLSLSCTAGLQIQTSMARIKYVLNERNLAYKAVQQAEVDRQAQEDHLAALSDELALAETGESAVDPSTQTGFEADIIAGRELPEPIQVRKFREEMRVASGRRGRTAERKARLPKRGDTEDVFKRLPGNAQRAEIAQKNREAVEEKEQAL